MTIPTPDAQWDVNTRGRSDDAPYDHINSNLGSNTGSPSTVTGSGGYTGLDYTGSTSVYSTLTYPGGISSSFPGSAFTMAVRMNIDDGQTANGGAFSAGSSTVAGEHLVLGHENLDEATCRWTDGDLHAGNMSGSTDISGVEGVLTVRRTTSNTAFLYWNGTQISTDSNVSNMDSWSLARLRWGVLDRGPGGIIWAFDGKVFWSAIWESDIGVTAIGELDDVANPFDTTTSGGARLVNSSLVKS